MFSSLCYELSLEFHFIRVRLVENLESWVLLRVARDARMKTARCAAGGRARGLMRPLWGAVSVVAVLV